MTEFQGARTPENANEVTVHALDSQIFSAFATELVNLAKGTGIGTPSIMACKVEVGTFRFKLGPGDTDDDLAIPTTEDHTDGSGSVAFVPADGIFYLSRPQILTFQGTGGSDVMSYWFIP